MPTDWFGGSGQRQTTLDGDELLTQMRVVSQDPMTGISVHELRVQQWRDDSMIREEIHSMKTEFYTRDELLLMLETAGFSDVDIYGDHTDELATLDHKNLMFVARK